MQQSTNPITITLGDKLGLDTAGNCDGSRFGCQSGLKESNILLRR
jgi:hypothetical protein